MERSIGLVLRLARRREEALEHFLAAHRAAVAAYGATHPDVIIEANLVGVCLTELGRPAEAEAWLRRAYDRRLELFGGSGWQTLESGRNLAQALKRLGRPAEALALYETALAGTKARRDTTRNDRVKARIPVAECLHTLGRYADEVRVRRRIVESVQDGLSKGAASSWRSLERALRAARLAGDAKSFLALDAHLPRGAGSIPEGLPEALVRDLREVLC